MFVATTHPDTPFISVTFILFLNSTRWGRRPPQSHDLLWGSCLLTDSAVFAFWSIVIQCVNAVYILGGVHSFVSFKNNGTVQHTNTHTLTEIQTTWAKLKETDMLHRSLTGTRLTRKTIYYRVVYSIEQRWEEDCHCHLTAMGLNTSQARACLCKVSCWNLRTTLSHFDLQDSCGYIW